MRPGLKRTRTRARKKRLILDTRNGFPEGSSAIQGVVRSSADLLAMAFLSCIASLAPAAESPAAFRISMQVVGTPGLSGPPRIDQAGFVPPVALSVLIPDHSGCLGRKRAGSYEATISVDGSVVGIHSRHEPVVGDECEKASLFPLLEKWRFRPATYQGNPVAVYMRFEIGM